MMTATQLFPRRLVFAAHNGSRLQRSGDLSSPTPGAPPQAGLVPGLWPSCRVLAPLAEQRRIVAKVDELMALVDALETQLATRQLHHAFQEIENKPFIIHPSSFILSPMLGSTLSNDQFSDKRFDFQFVNPPYGYEWSKNYAAVTTRRDLHPNLRADYVLANPRFNDFAAALCVNAFLQCEAIPQVVSEPKDSFRKHYDVHREVKLQVACATFPRRGITLTNP